MFLKRDDLHLSRIMFQQDLYRQNGDIDETSDTMKDANDTLSKGLRHFFFHLSNLIFSMNFRSSIKTSTKFTYLRI